MKKLGIIIICFLIFGTLYGCKSSRSKSTFLEGSPCSPPCWYDIRPGKTSEQELLESLQSIPIVDESSITTHGGQWKIFDNIVYFSLPEELESEVYILQNKVSMIDFTGRMDISAEEAINRFDEPQKALFLYSRGETSVILIYPEKGIILRFTVDGVPKEIKPTSKLNLISYFDPDSYQELLDAGIIAFSMLNGQETLDKIKPWTGFGLISTEYPINKTP